jgi:hypothetical protein
MEYRTLFAEIHRRPGLYGLDGSYAQFCVFIDGVDTGNDRQLLTGFREWLVTRLGTGNNLVWRGLVLHLAFPGAGAAGRDVSTDPDRNRVAVDALFALLDEFLERRRAHGALAEIYDAYLTWLKAQSWYAEPTGAVGRGTGHGPTRHEDRESAEP